HVVQQHRHLVFVGCNISVLCWRWRCWPNAVAAACNFLFKWGTTGSANGQFITPRGIATDSAGNVYVADQNDRVQKFDSSGTFLFKFATGGSSAGAVIAASGVAVDAAGNIYVTDSDPDRSSGMVQKFNSSGPFDGPQGVAADGLGNIYVADTNNNRIEKFDSTGTFISTCGVSGNGDGEFSGPQDVAADTAGNSYVADTGNDRVQKFGAATAS